MKRHGHLRQFVALPLGIIVALAGSGVASAQEPRVARQPPLAYDSLLLNSYSTEELLEFLTDSSQRFNNTSRHQNPVHAIAMELVRRRSYSALLRRFGDSRDLAQESWVEKILSTIRDPVSDSGMTVFAKRTLDVRSFFALKYFARVGTPWALEILDSNYGQYTVPSYEWAEIVELFGFYRYTPAAHHIAESIGSFPDIGVAAIESLVAMYPAGKDRFETAVDARQYWLLFLQRFKD